MALALAAVRVSQLSAALAGFVSAFRFFPLTPSGPRFPHSLLGVPFPSSLVPRQTEGYGGAGRSADSVSTGGSAAADCACPGFLTQDENQHPVLGKRTSHVPFTSETREAPLGWCAHAALSGQQCGPPSKERVSGVQQVEGGSCPHLARTDGSPAANSTEFPKPRSMATYRLERTLCVWDSQNTDHCEKLLCFITPDAFKT